MGLLLSILVVCVGVLEAVSCFRHIQDGYVPFWMPRRVRPMIAERKPSADDDASSSSEEEISKILVNPIATSRQETHGYGLTPILTEHRRLTPIPFDDVDDVVDDQIKYVENNIDECRRSSREDGLITEPFRPISPAEADDVHDKAAAAGAGASPGVVSDESSETVSDFDALTYDDVQNNNQIGFRSPADTSCQIHFTDETNCPTVGKENDIIQPNQTYGSLEQILDATSETQPISTETPVNINNQVDVAEPTCVIEKNVNSFTMLEQQACQSAEICLPTRDPKTETKLILNNQESSSRDRDDKSTEVCLVSPASDQSNLVKEVQRPAVGVEQQVVLSISTLSESPDSSSSTSVPTPARKSSLHDLPTRKVKADISWPVFRPDAPVIKRPLVSLGLSRDVSLDEDLLLDGDDEDDELVERSLAADKSTVNLVPSLPSECSVTKHSESSNLSQLPNSTSIPSSNTSVPSTQEETLPPTEANGTSACEHDVEPEVRCPDIPAGYDDTSPRISVKETDILVIENYFSNTTPEEVVVDTPPPTGVVSEDAGQSQNRFVSLSDILQPECKADAVISSQVAVSTTCSSVLTVEKPYTEVESLKKLSQDVMTLPPSKSTPAEHTFTPTSDGVPTTTDADVKSSHVKREYASTPTPDGVPTTKDVEDVKSSHVESEHASTPTSDGVPTTTDVEEVNSSHVEREHTSTPTPDGISSTIVIEEVESAHEEREHASTPTPDGVPTTTDVEDVKSPHVEREHASTPTSDGVPTTTDVEDVKSSHVEREHASTPTSDGVPTTTVVEDVKSSHVEREHASTPTPDGVPTTTVVENVKSSHVEREHASTPTSDGVPTTTDVEDVKSSHVELEHASTPTSNGAPMATAGADVKSSCVPTFDGVPVIPADVDDVDSSESLSLGRDITSKESSIKRRKSYRDKKRSVTSKNVAANSEGVDAKIGSVAEHTAVVECEEVPCKVETQEVFLSTHDVTGAALDGHESASKMVGDSKIVTVDDELRVSDLESREEKAHDDDDDDVPYDADYKPDAIVHRRESASEAIVNKVMLPTEVLKSTESAVFATKSHQAARRPLKLPARAESVEEASTVADRNTQIAAAGGGREKVRRGDKDVEHVDGGRDRVRRSGDETNTNGDDDDDDDEEESSVDETESASMKQPVQGAFWLIFSGEYTKAMSKDWHSGHFCCWQCDESLTGQRYVLRDDHPYCIKCYESVFANMCEECNKTIGIDSKDLSYKDKHWHEACFLCNKCRVSLVDKQFGSKADKIYCGNCYDSQFASRCDGCGEIFRAGTKKMEYKTRQWHEKCFCCCVCKSAIGTKSFIPREQEIYCATCYEEKFATRCVKCNKIITSGGVTYKNEPWHRECFTCTHCSTSLAGQRFTSRDEKPYCAECFGELFAKRCTACVKPITGIGGTRFISFEDRHWHNDCFICASCKTSLVGRGFITDADDIICPECAKQKLM